jgi:hypothetical protein
MTLDEAERRDAILSEAIRLKERGGTQLYDCLMIAYAIEIERDGYLTVGNTMA